METQLEPDGVTQTSTFRGGSVRLTPVHYYGWEQDEGNNLLYHRKEELLLCILKNARMQNTTKILYMSSVLINV